MDKVADISTIVHMWVADALLRVFLDCTEQNAWKEKSKGFPNSFALKHLMTRLVGVSGAVAGQLGRLARVESGGAEVEPHKRRLASREAKDDLHFSRWHHWVIAVSRR